MGEGRVYSLNVGLRKGVSKTPVAEGYFRREWGLRGDVHGGKGKRQVSLLPWESIKKQSEIFMRKKAKCPKALSEESLKPGDFAENITTQGIDLKTLKVGDRLKVGKEVVLEVTRIGKECHRYCSIYYKLGGDCLMPREGVFARVVKGGWVKEGEEITLIAPGEETWG